MCEIGQGVSELAHSTCVGQHYTLQYNVAEELWIPTLDFYVYAFKSTASYEWYLVRGYTTNGDVPGTSYKQTAKAQHSNNYEADSLATKVCNKRIVTC